jgi:hypothetical protein
MLVRELVNKRAKHPDKSTLADWAFSVSFPVEEAAFPVLVKAAAVPLSRYLD